MKTKEEIEEELEKHKDYYKAFEQKKKDYARIHQEALEDVVKGNYIEDIEEINSFLNKVFMYNDFMYEEEMKIELLEWILK